MACRRANFQNLASAKVLKYAEDPENHSHLGRTSTLFDVIDLFEKFAIRGKDLDAILITESGRPEGALLGILTLYDLPQVLRHLGLKDFSGS